MSGPIILATLIVDTPDEAPARAILADFAAKAALEAADPRWAPYPKLGPHSKVSALLRLPFCPDGQAVIDAVEALAALAVVPKALPDAYLNSFIQDDGALFYNRIFDARTSAFRDPAILWMDLEAHTHPGRQAALAAHFPS